MATGSSLLLADDSITIQKVINLTFADEGMNVTTVGNGDLAMAKIEEISPDIVMLDVHMPGLNGYEICERLKQSDRFRNMPVILLVGSFEPFDEDEARRVGADDFLTKPFQSIRQLITKVGSLLQDRPTGSLAPAAEPVEEADNAALEYEVAPGQDFLGTSNAVGISSETPAPAESPAAMADTWSGDNNGYAQEAGIDDELIETRPATGSMEHYDTFTGGSRATRPLSSMELNDMNFGSPAVGSVETGTLNRGRKTEVYSAADESILELGDVDTRTADFDEPVLELGGTEVAPEEPEGLARFDHGGDLSGGVVYDDALEVEPEPVAGEMDAAGAMDAEVETAESPEVAMEAAPEVAAIFEPEPEPLVDPLVEAAAPAVAAAPVAFSADQLSPEVIDAIARRVVERMSDSAVREIAWEVVPQLADLHIKKKMDEQK